MRAPSGWGPRARSGTLDGTAPGRGASGQRVRPPARAALRARAVLPWRALAAGRDAVRPLAPLARARWAALGLRAARPRPRRRASASPISAGISEGMRATGTPAAWNAAIFPAAVPLPPEMIAPAWAMPLQGGAVWE